MLIKPRLLLISLCNIVLISACQHQPAEPVQTIKTQHITEDFQHASGLMHCFPLAEDANNRPIDQLVLPVAPGENIWPRIQAGLAFDYVDHPAVQQQLNWYVKHPEYLSRVQKRAERYLYQIVEVLHEKKVPLDIALLPIVESAYEPFAYSHGQASGLWQFIPMTGDRFHLDRDWWQDERRDVHLSSVAAAKYLSYLHRYFDDDWQLAVAAYNAGEGNVRKAVRKNKKKGLPIDFFSLDLPKETSAYVPKLIALAEIFRHPEKYNIKLEFIANSPYYDEVNLDSQLDLAQAARLMDVPVDEVYYLNASLNRWATPPTKKFALKVPLDKKPILIEALAALPANERVNWHRHTIKSGDSLSSIAAQYKSQVALIKDVNRLKNNSIVMGKTLMVPTASAGSKTYAYSQSQRKNKRKATQPKDYRYRSYHIVKTGDSFWSLSQKYHHDTQVLAKWNAKSPKDTLRVGEKLVIWHKTPQASFSRQPNMKKLHYKVKKGDSLARVASKFNVRIPQIVDWNPIDPQDYLRPGQKLTLYVDVSETF